MSPRSLSIDRRQSRDHGLGAGLELEPACEHRLRLVIEVEPPTRPHLDSVTEQVRHMAPISSTFVVPDNSFGRAALSSLWTSKSVLETEGWPVAVVNSRDRSPIGFGNDLLTAAALGIRDLLLVRGDRTAKASHGDLTVASMLEATRAFNARFEDEIPPLRVAVTTRLAPLPAWKQAADALFVQGSFCFDRLVEWRRSIQFAGPVFAGVLVATRPAMIRRLEASTDEIRIPDKVVGGHARDPFAGVELACDAIARIAATGLFDGIHLIAPGRHREVAAKLASLGVVGRTAIPSDAVHLGADRVLI